MLQLDLESKLDVKRELNVFKYNPDFEAAQAEWAAIRKELLGGDSDEDGSGSGGSGDDDDEDESDEDEAAAAGAPAPPTQVRGRTYA